MEIPKTKNDKYFHDWIKLWSMCTATGGDYFEGDKINLDESYEFYSNSHPTF